MKFDPTRDNLFSMRDEVAHTKLRAKMAAGVSLTYAMHVPVVTCFVTVFRQRERVDGGVH